MPRIEHGVAGQSGQTLQTRVHVGGVAAGKIGTTTSVEEQRVPRHETTAHEKTLASRGVPRGVDEFDVDVTQRDPSTGILGDEFALGDTRRAHHPGQFGALDVHPSRGPLEQTSHTFDREPHHRPTHMIGVIVRRQHIGDAQTVRFDEIDEFVHGVRGIHDRGLAGGAVADHVHEGHHLGRDRIADGEIPTRQQLAEVQLVAHRTQRRSWTRRLGA